MTKQIAVFLLVALAVLASQAAAGIIAPIGLAPGSEYQLIFATADTTNAVSPLIDIYNVFVLNEAAMSHSLPAATWSDVGSTTTANANANAPNVVVDGSYLPVYNTQGILVSDNASGGLYSGTLLSGVKYDQYGNLATSDASLGFALTGTTAAGGAASADPLGTSHVSTGYSGDTGAGWTNAGQYSPYATYGLYGLSSVLVATPEPSGLALLGSAFLLIGGMRFVRRRKV